MPFYFQEMEANEAGTRAGEDIEFLHDMRVAIRRMRSAFTVFNGAFTPKAVRKHQKRLKLSRRALGRVRDLDVFLEKAARYLQTLPEGDRDGLDPLLHHWQTEREQARQKMIAYLDSETFCTFKQKCNYSAQAKGRRKNKGWGCFTPPPLVFSGILRVAALPSPEKI